MVFQKIYSILIQIIRKIIIISSYLITGQFYEAKLELKRWNSYKRINQFDDESFNIITEESSEDDSNKIFTDDEIHEIVDRNNFLD